MTEPAKPRAVGLNHIALEVGDIEEALAFYGRLFRFELRGKSDTMAFIDLGDQFIALQKGCKQPADDGRHFGLRGLHPLCCCFPIEATFHVRQSDELA